MPAKSNVLHLSGTRILLNGAPFYYQGLSFFNAIYNPTFNRSRDERIDWLTRFKANGINALRIWCQWDFPPERTFVDRDPSHTLYTDDGAVKEDHFGTLQEILMDADKLGMVVEVTLFSQERDYYLPVPSMERACRELTHLLKPFRNLILQIWNEESYEVKRFFEAIKQEDEARLVTNSPGGSNNLGDEEQNSLLDLLTPHTVRREAKRFWKHAPQQIHQLMMTYRKPVIDDEPARTGIMQYGGIEGGTDPKQHIEQCRRVREIGGYHLYHHDMFQRPYGNAATPPTGIPDPDFSPFHRQIFDYLKSHTEWDPLYT